MTASVMKELNPSVSLICCANQLTGFYIRATLAFNGLKKQVVYHKKVFRSNKSSFLKEKVQNSLIVDISTLREKLIVKTTAGIRYPLRFQMITIFAKRSILDVWQGSGYAPVKSKPKNLHLNSSNIEFYSLKKYIRPLLNHFCICLLTFR